MNQTRWMIACLILLTIAVYWPVCRYGAIDYDDNQYVFKNPHVQAGFCMAGINYAFTTFNMGNWNPVLWISFYTDRLMLGLRPQLMHVENVGLHLICGFLIWRLLYLCTGRIKSGFVVAAIFLCHPMHVESVAWISERKDVLSTPLLLGAMLAYVGYCRAVNQERRSASSGIICYLTMTVLFSLSLMTKPMGVTFPAVLMLMDFWPLRRWPARSWTKLVVEKLPLFVLSIFAVVLVTKSQAAVGSRATIADLALSARLENAVVCYAIYIAKLAIPTNLALYYGHPGSRPLASVFGAGGLLVLITLLVYRARPTMPALLMGWLWFLGTLVPVIGLVQVGSQSMADRYSYFPSIGLSIAVVWGMAAITPRIIGPHLASIALACLCAVVITVYSVMANHQVQYWKNTYVMFTHVLQVSPDDSLPHDQLATLALDRNDLATAFREYGHARDLSPDPVAFDGMGICYLHVDYAKAIENFRIAVGMTPSSALYHEHLATALRRHGDLIEARKEAEIAINLDPELEEARQELAAIVASLNTQAHTSEQKKS